MYVRESVRCELSIFPFLISTGFIPESQSRHKFNRDCNGLGVSSDTHLYSTQKRISHNREKPEFFVGLEGGWP
jgi:hypothetical protein